MARLNKFGTVKSELDVRSKPVGDFSFAFVDIDISAKQLEKLKMALNGTLFMGRKLTVSVAAPDLQHRWKKDSARPDISQKLLKKHDSIAQNRALRIRESQASVPCNSITGAAVASTALLAPNNSSSGFRKSAHTFNDASGNTKNKPPQHDLVGKKSYGAQLKPRGTFAQQYSRTSGRGEVVRGRHRTTQRPAAYFARKQQTMRTLINGELKLIKCYKEKLWGVEKKANGELTYRFSNGSWLSGDDHVVERVDIGGKHLCGITGADATIYGAEARDDGASEAGDGDDFLKDQNTNVSVLRDLFALHDFDKPVELEEPEQDDMGGFDFEAHGGIDSDDDSDSSNKPKRSETVEQFLQSHERPAETAPFDEDDEGNQMDVDDVARNLTTEAIKDTYDRELGETDDGDDEVISETKDEQSDGENDETIGKKKETENKDQETLRTLFDPSGQGVQKLMFAGEPGFKLALDESDDDIDTDKKAMDEEQQRQLMEQIEKKQQEERERDMKEATQQKKAQFGLFWAHTDSPFLQTQTQLSKIGRMGEAIVLPGEEEDSGVRDDGHGEEDGYERWFWLKRGEISRLCKMKKRDVLKLQRKKKVKPVV